MINLKPGSEIFRIQKYFKIMKTDYDKCQESCDKTGLETLRGHMATAAAATSYNWASFFNRPWNSAIYANWSVSRTIKIPKNISKEFPKICYQVSGCVWMKVWSDPCPGLGTICYVTP